MGAIQREETDIINLEKLLQSRGYDEDQIRETLSKAAILIPEGKIKTLQDKEYELIKPHFVTINKLLKKEIVTEFVKNKKYDHVYEEHLSADIIVPLIIFTSTTSWDIGKNIVSSWIYDAFIAHAIGSKKPTAHFEAEIRDETKGIYKHIIYDGPADEVSKVIRESKEY